MSFTLLSEAERTARKAHRCIWCWESIRVGDRYLDERSIYDGNMQRNRFHPECHDAMRQAASEEGGVIEWIPGENERPVKAPAPQADQGGDGPGSA